MSRAVVLALVASVALTASCDPVVSDAIDALGGEAPGVRRGPLHRPGQPCLLCHDGDLGDPPAFSVAGTVYNDPVDLGGEDNVTVSLTDSTGASYQATTNSAGNFYVTPAEWTPVFPLTVSISDPSTGITRDMQSQVGRDGACASCHVSPVSASSPGPVVESLYDGGVPP